MKAQAGKLYCTHLVGNSWLSMVASVTEKDTQKIRSALHRFAVGNGPSSFLETGLNENILFYLAVVNFELFRRTTTVHNQRQCTGQDGLSCAQSEESLCLEDSEGHQRVLPWGQPWGSWQIPVHSWTIWIPLWVFQFLVMIVNGVYLECDDTICLCGGQVLLAGLNGQKSIDTYY